jgi:iduronate 2-sulfatase
VLPVLFLVSDDMRPSIGGHYALPEAHTPNLERLMDEGITFARAYIQYSYCSPSRNS